MAGRCGPILPERLPARNPIPGVRRPWQSVRDLGWVGTARVCGSITGCQPRSLQGLRDPPLASTRSMRSDGPYERLPPLPGGTVQIHAWRSDDGHWSAAFDWHPEVSFGGDTALVAAKRLVRSAEGMDESTLRIAFGSEDDQTPGSLSFPLDEAPRVRRDRPVRRAGGHRALQRVRWLWS